MCCSAMEEEEEKKKEEGGQAAAAAGRRAGCCHKRRGKSLSQSEQGCVHVVQGVRSVKHSSSISVQKPN